MTEASGVVPVLSLDGITRRFGSLLALDAASMQLRAGTVHALLGENGAGKTTLMRVAFGMVSADSGTIARNGAPARMTSPSVALASGIGMVHQHFTLVPAMTVAENIALGGRGVFNPRAAAARVQELAERTRLSIDANAVVGELPIGAQQRCEIMKALARNVSILIMDEPTSVLAPSEAQELLAWLRRFASEGNSVVLITHKLRDALSIADNFTVLRRGRTVLSARASEVSESILASAMLGEISGTDGAVDETFPSRTDRPSGGVVLQARAITMHDERGVARVRDVSLDIHAGEIVGIAAVEGAGQHELLRALAGRAPISSGKLNAPPAVGFVPEDRHRDALMLDATLAENVALKGAAVRRGLVAWDAIARATESIIDASDVRTSVERAQSTARMLSGGNQQKLVLGRELANSPTALVVENPTRGLDFRATKAVHRALRDAALAGTAVVLYSSDIDEVLALSDRIVALHNGSATEVAIDRDAVGRAMLGTA